MEKQRKTFLSYSRANKDFAIRLAKELKVEGFDLWLDQLDIPAGSRWDREVEKALRESDIFMIILTPASVDSENVLDEIGYAIDNGKRFLPVLLEKCEVPLRLRRFQYVDFTNKSFDDGVESAKDLLRSLTIQQASFTAAQVQAEVEHKAKEEADRLAALQAEEEQLAKEKADLERRVKEEAERLYTQKAEEERQAKAKADAERKAKAEARRKAKEEANRLAAQKTAEERRSQAVGDAERNIIEESDYSAPKKAEEARLVKQKAEEELVTKGRAEKKRKDKEEADRLAAQKIEAVSLAEIPVSNTQKKLISKRLVIGIVTIVLFVIAGLGIKVILNSNAVATEAPLVNVTRDLIYYENGKYNPDLITDRESDSDQTVWTFHLSKDVILKNGDHLTSKTIEEYLTIKNLVRSGKAKVEIVDDFTFTVTLSQAQVSQDLFKTLSEQGYICRQ